MPDLPFCSFSQGPTCDFGSGEHCWTLSRQPEDFMKPSSADRRLAPSASLT